QRHEAGEREGREDEAGGHAVARAEVEDRGEERLDDDDLAGEHEGGDDLDHEEADEQHPPGGPDEARRAPDELPQPPDGAPLVAALDLEVERVEQLAVLVAHRATSGEVTAAAPS